MLTPTKGKTNDVDSTDRSPKSFRWVGQYEDTLLDLLVREARKGNRPDSTFTAVAFRNVVKDFNKIEGTSIMKKHVQNRIKTMKKHFVLFHGAFNGLSGFAWNPETKMFEAEDFLWEQRIKENPRLEKLRDKPCRNWDKLYELYGDTRANGEGAFAMKEKSKTIQRDLKFEDLNIGSNEQHVEHSAAYEGSSYAEHELPRVDTPPVSTPEYIPTQQSAGSSRSKLKRKASLMSVMEDGYKSLSASIDKLSTTLLNTGEKVAASKVDVNLNSRVSEVLASLDLDCQYRVRCYCYLCANPSKGTLLAAAPNDIRGILLADIMKEQGDPQ